ncbi:MAG: ATP-binding protein [Acidobacteria bacterium]|nr:ATP-binding protein [Acidobacteriota bacterium]
MIERPALMKAVQTALRRNPIAAILGARQCGKTTLAHMIAAGRKSVHYLDLEDPAVLAGLENPMTMLGGLKGLVIIDEIQRRPELFPVLRLLADREARPARFLILGSASPDLIRQSSESLAGRIEFMEMGGFDLFEAGADSWRSLWLRGGFPRSFLADSEDDSAAWREQFVRTFLERDIPQLGINLPALLLRRFWTMVAHYHGQTWNSAEIASSLGVSDHTARRYLDILAGAYMLRVLAPWHENLAKRQRRAPKVYLRDSGLLHTLLGIGDPDALWRHPKCGSSWEGFAMEQVLRLAPSRAVYYWAVHGGPELDLMTLWKGRRIGFEFKFADAPRMASTVETAVRDLRLHKLWIIYPGTKRYLLAEKVEALPLVSLSVPFGEI